MDIVGAEEKRGERPERAHTRGNSASYPPTGTIDNSCVDRLYRFEWSRSPYDWLPQAASAPPPFLLFSLSVAVAHYSLSLSSDRHPHDENLNPAAWSLRLRL